MKLKLVDIFKSASGKICHDSEFYAATRNGKTYSGRLCHPAKREKSAAQKAATDKFAKVQKIVSTILKSGPGNDAYDEYTLAYKSNPTAAETLHGFIFRKEYEKL